MLKSCSEKLYKICLSLSEEMSALEWEEGCFLPFVVAAAAAARLVSTPYQLFIGVRKKIGWGDSVTRSGDLLDFGQLLKAFDNN